jgi:hypothetical protein
MLFVKGKSAMSPSAAPPAAPRKARVVPDRVGALVPKSLMARFDAVAASATPTRPAPSRPVCPGAPRKATAALEDAVNVAVATQSLTGRFDAAAN